MDERKVIPFNFKQRLIKKAADYLDAYDATLNCPENAIPLLLRALNVVDRPMKHRIISLLGTQTLPELVWPLYKLMADDKESDDIRHHASVQLSIAATELENPQELIACLTKDLNSPCSFTRALAVFALGWEGNLPAAIALIEKLYDPDSEVQEAAVDALANLGDQRIFPFLVDQLEHAPMELKKVILYNLAGFSDYHDELMEIYNRYIEHEDPELRCDALAVMGSIAASDVFMAAIQRGLRDSDCQVKTLCLENLSDFSSDELAPISMEIMALAADPEPTVRKAAGKLLASIGPLDLSRTGES